MLKLLIADDEPFVRKGLLMNIPFKEMGISDVEQADDGQVALKIAATFQPDIILSDIRMPNLNGIELATRVREILPDCKIIFMSGYSDKEYLKAAISLKAISYVEKPIDLDEITEAIKSAAELCKDEKSKKINLDEMKNKLVENLFHTNNNIVLDLINRKINMTYISEVLKLSDLQFRAEDEYSVLVIKLRHTYLQQFHIQEFLGRIQQVLQQCNIYGLSGYKNDGQIIVIARGNSYGNEMLRDKELLELGNNIISSFRGELEVFVGIGSKVKGIENINLSYETGLNAQRYLFYKGYNKCSVHKEGVEEAFLFSGQRISDFKSVLDENHKKASEYIRQITKEMRLQENVLPNYVKDVYIRLLQVLYDIARSRGMEVSEIDSKAFYWDSLSRCETLNEVEKYMLDKLEAYYEAIEGTGASSKVITSVIKIVNQEYSNEDLSIKGISQSIFLSDAYLCVIFKKETGKTLNQYITEVRIEKAKEFLKDKNIKVFDIARKVGYRDHNYFTKIFKKVTSMTPSEYKERFLI